MVTSEVYGMHNSRQNTLAWDRNQADLKPNTGYRHGRND